LSCQDHVYSTTDEPIRLHNKKIDGMRCKLEWQNPFFKRQNTFSPPGFCHRTAVLQTQEPKLCTDPDLGLLYILILGTYSKFDRRNNFPSLGVCLPQHWLERWPQVCCVKITFTKVPTNRFVSTTKISMKYVVNWIPLRIRVRSRNTQPHLNNSGFFSCVQISLVVNTKRCVLN